ncbi:MAG: ABC transporter ATP-binding protein [Planctomycetota bacterium]
MSSGTLVLEGVTKRHPGSVRASLDRVDLDAAAGHILVLLGTSGAGKTTLLRLVAGLEDADAGRIRLGARVLSDPDVRVAPEARGVGLVFQHLELWPHMTVAENIAFGLPGRPRRRQALRDAQVRAWAARVGVGHLLARSPATLSGGERQRVAIARTMAPGPGVLLYDEPLANLDPARRRDLRQEIRGLCRAGGTTLVYVTHDPEEAMAVGDEIAVLERGRLVERGEPSRLYRHPRTLAGGRALGPVNALDARPLDGDRVEAVLGVLGTEGTTGPGPFLALLRPEAVVAGGRGAVAEVIEVRPHAAHWVFSARVGETTVEGRSARRVEPGAVVRLEARGPVTVVAAEEAA